MKVKRSFWFSPMGLLAIALLIALGGFLLLEHRLHVYEWLPILVLLACPLMHVFMHRGHHKHKSNDQEE